MAEYLADAAAAGRPGRGGRRPRCRRRHRADARHPARARRVRAHAGQRPGGPAVQEHHRRRLAAARRRPPTCWPTSTSLDGLIPFNDETMLGAVEALREAGRLGEVKMVSQERHAGRGRAGQGRASTTAPGTSTRPASGRPSPTWPSGSASTEDLDGLCVSSPIGRMITAERAEAWVPWQERIPYHALKPFAPSVIEYCRSCLRPPSLSCRTCLASADAARTVRTVSRVGAPVGLLGGGEALERRAQDARADLAAVLARQSAVDDRGDPGLVTLKMSMPTGVPRKPKYGILKSGCSATVMSYICRVHPHHLLRPSRPGRPAGRTPPPGRTRRARRSR